MLRELPAIAATRGEECAASVLSSHLRELNELQRQLKPEDVETQILNFRRDCHQLLLQSEFGYYVFVRPRGYPGDYFTQEMMWLGRTQGGEHRYRGVTELGKLLTSITFDMAAPRANELRLRRLRETLSHFPNTTVASIGCGSGIEYWEPLEIAPRAVFLLDQDADALNRAEQALGNANLPYTTCKENIVKYILRNEQCRQMGTHGFIYSLGLLDYFPIRIAKRIVESLWTSVSAGGTLLLTNAHPSNPTRLWMEWVSEWKLDYKTEDQFKSLVAGLGGVAHVDYDIDDFGVYQYLTVHKA